MNSGGEAAGAKEIVDVAVGLHPGLNGCREDLARKTREKTVGDGSALVPSLERDESRVTHLHNRSNWEEGSASGAKSRYSEERTSVGDSGVDGRSLRAKAGASSTSCQDITNDMSALSKVDQHYNPKDSRQDWLPGSTRPVRFSGWGSCWPERSTGT